MLFLGTGYEVAFDRFELIYALQHAYERKLEGKDVWGPVGRFGWKRQVINELVEEVDRQGSSWGPLKAGLFGGSLDEFKAVVADYSKLVDRLSWY
jgi:hypothetical protein